MNTSISCLRHHSLSRALRHGAEICQCLHFHFVPCMLVQPSSVFFNVASRFSCCGHYHISNLGRQFPPSHHPTSILNVCCTFHASSVLLLVPLKNSKKKIIKPVNLKKRTKHLLPAHVHLNMTVQQLADAVQKSIDETFEVLSFIKDGTGDIYTKPSSVIDNFNVIQQAVSISGRKCMMVSSHIKTEKPVQNLDVQPQSDPDPSVLVSRPPIVTIMGHVDHGKTTLLDYLRKSNIVAQEFGGITQHIGAFKVHLPSGDSICFMDTPGHAAFSAMRGRGAHITDIVILVVSADDGVMPQTLESIGHANAAGVPIIVAINKIDKDNANIERTKNMLLEHQVFLEEFGGHVQAVPISALKIHEVSGVEPASVYQWRKSLHPTAVVTDSYVIKIGSCSPAMRLGVYAGTGTGGTNMDILQDAIVMQAAVMELKGDPIGLVEGHIVEAKSDCKRGKVATAVIQRGTLKRGNNLVAGTTWAKVKFMLDDRGKQLCEASLSSPVEIFGWRDVPSAGDSLCQVVSESKAKAIVEWRLKQLSIKKQQTDSVEIEKYQQEHRQIYQEAFRQRLLGGFHTSRYRAKTKEDVSACSDSLRFPFILKGDVDGSVDAIMGTLEKYHSKHCHLDVIHTGVGNVTQTDVNMAEAFKGEIFAFNVSVPSEVRRLATVRHVVIHSHNVIYRLFEQLTTRITNILPLAVEEEAIGEANVLQTFFVNHGKFKLSVGGCVCSKGLLLKNKNFRVERQGHVIFKGVASSLRYFKDEVDSIKRDMECGVQLDDKAFVFEVGDKVVCYEMKEVKQELDWSPGF